MISGHVDGIRLSDSARRVLEKRYLLENETPEQMFRRVARNVAGAENAYDDGDAAKWEEAFYGIMTRMEFLPNSPTLMNAGTGIQQLSACFVLPIEDSMEGIFDSLKQSALIHKSGGGTGFSFSKIRPSGDIVDSTRGVSSGPISFMQVFDAATETVKQGGRRRGANMAILRVDHPDIIDFISAKSDNDRLTNFNISVAITDEFVHALRAGEDYDLINPRSGEVSGRQSAREVFELIVDGAWKNGEPGIVFIDKINADNPTPHVGEIESTNPCGEQPLLPYESCNLGSINLAAMVTGETGDGRLDWDKLSCTVHTATRFLDDVIDVNRYPLPEVEAMTRANRKIGLGVMGFADMLVGIGISYDSDRAVMVADEVMAFVDEQGRAASRDLAESRGAFPNFPGSAADLRGEPPVRNATVTTIAPTGSISIIANTSSGVEPVFALALERHVLDGDKLTEAHPLFAEVAEREGFASPQLMEKIAQAGNAHEVEEVPERWRELFKTSHEVEPSDHVRIQAAFQKHTDNAVSKTVNLPNAASREDVETVFMLAHELDCKGVTVYRDGSRDAQVLNITRDKTEAAPVPSHPDRLMPRPRAHDLVGLTSKVETGCGNIYVTINEDEHGPFELFAHIGKAGGCAGSQTEAIGRLVSLALRAGVDSRSIVAQLRGVRCPSPGWNDGQKVFSCADAISIAMGRYLSSRKSSESGDKVPVDSVVNRLAGVCVECGNILELEGGCAVCRMCGYSRC